jgi:GntR family transcriptional regulator
VARALELEPAADVYEIERVRLADEQPVALERTFFPQVAFPGLIDHPLEGSLYDLMRQHYGDVPRRAVERLEPTLATSEQAAALEVAEGAPLMLVERVAYSGGGVPLEFSHELFRGDRTRVVVHISELR